MLYSLVPIPPLPLTKWTSTIRCYWQGIPANINTIHVCGSSVTHMYYIWPAPSRPRQLGRSALAIDTLQYSCVVGTDPVLVSYPDLDLKAKMGRRVQHQHRGLTLRPATCGSSRPVGSFWLPSHTTRRAAWRVNNSYATK